MKIEMMRRNGEFFLKTKEGTVLGVSWMHHHDFCVVLQESHRNLEDKGHMVLVRLIFREKGYMATCVPKSSGSKQSWTSWGTKISKCKSVKYQGKWQCYLSEAESFSPLWRLPSLKLDFYYFPFKKASDKCQSSFSSVRAFEQLSRRAVSRSWERRQEVGELISKSLSLGSPVLKTLLRQFPSLEDRSSLVLEIKLLSMKACLEGESKASGLNRKVGLVLHHQRKM